MEVQGSSAHECAENVSNKALAKNAEIQHILFRGATILLGGRWLRRRLCFPAFKISKVCLRGLDCLAMFL